MITEEPLWKLHIRLHRPTRQFLLLIAPSSQIKNLKSLILAQCKKLYNNIPPELYNCPLRDSQYSELDPDYTVSDVLHPGAFIILDPAPTLQFPIFQASVPSPSVITSPAGFINTNMNTNVIQYPNTTAYEFSKDFANQSINTSLLQVPILEPINITNRQSSISDTQLIRPLIPDNQSVRQSPISDTRQLLIPEIQHIPEQITNTESQLLVNAENKESNNKRKLVSDEADDIEKKEVEKKIIKKRRVVKSVKEAVEAVPAKRVRKPSAKLKESISNTKKLQMKMKILKN